MTRKRKDYRELKVSSFSGYGYKSAPMLRIQGLWLYRLRSFSEVRGINS